MLANLIQWDKESLKNWLDDFKNSERFEKTVPLGKHFELKKIFMSIFFHIIFLLNFHKFLPIYFTVTFIIIFFFYKLK